MGIKDISNIGISQEVLNKVISIISSNSKVCKIVIFGSRSRGDFKVVSDIDIAIFSETLSLPEYLKILSDVDDIDIPQKIDLVWYEKIKDEDFKKEILANGIVVYEK